MTTIRWIKSGILIAALTFIISCDSLKIENQIVTPEQLIPEETSIYVPSALNSDGTESRIKALDGDTIFNYIRVFVNLAVESSMIVESSYQRIRALKNNGVLEFSYTDIDGETKNVSIVEDYTDSLSTHWDCYMEIYNESFANLVLKAWWNKDPLEQKIIVKPAGLNTLRMSRHADALAEIYYKSGELASPYEKSISISLYNLQASENTNQPNNIMVFIGENGNILDICGNSNNPYAILFDTNTEGGRNWAFVAKLNLEQNLAAATLALPPSSLETNENLLNEYSLRTVIVNELRALYPSESLTDEELLSNNNISEVENPVYFNNDGFVSSGTTPGGNYSGLDNFEGMTPFIPANVRDYELEL